MPLKRGVNSKASPVKEKVKRNKMKVREGWYKGRKHCIIISPLSSLKTVKVKWDDETFDIVPVRLCWRWKRNCRPSKKKIVRAKFQKITRQNKIERRK